MAVTEMFFDGESGRDIHTLRFQSTHSLIPPGNLTIRDSGVTSPASAYVAAHPEIDLDFRPLFIAVDNGTHYSGFNILVNKRTGEVSFVSGLPAPAVAPDNFLIECHIVPKDGTVGPSVSAVIRVHVHTSVTRFWMTPPALTIHRMTAAGADSAGYRFSVRAQFNDDVIADITSNHSIGWQSPSLQFDTDGNITIPAGVATGAAPTTVALTATAPAAWGVAPASASVVVAQPWQSEPNLPSIELVDGPDRTFGPSPDPAQVPNLLFLAQGFTAVDQPQFNDLTLSLVNSMKGDPITVPYDLLAGAMNYWRVAPPAPSRGIPIRCEVYLMDALDENGFIREAAFPVPAPEHPIENVAWTVENLIYAVGLPLPGDAARTDVDLIARWRGLISPSRLPSVISAGVIQGWRDLASRTFFEEFDTFPAMVRGEPPNASKKSDRGELYVIPDPERGGLPETIRFVAALQSSTPVALPGGARLGAIWSTGVPGSAFESTRLLAYISNSNGRGNKGLLPGTNNGYVSAPLNKIAMVAPHDHVPGSRGLTVNQLRMTPNARKASGMFRTVAHEFAHAFGLGDEYVTIASNFPATEAKLAEDGNLTTEAAVRNTAGGKLDSQQIKWNWERVRKAAITAGPLQALGGGLHEIPVVGSQALAFRDLVEHHETVRIRQRTPGKVLQLAPATSADYTVDSVSADGTSLRVRESVPSTAAMAAGSLIYAPVPTSASVAYRHARMITPTVEKYIDDNNRPLTPKVCDPQMEANRGGDSQDAEEWLLLIQPAGLTWSRRNVPLIVGLYAGGDQFACGIFHPVGWCMMRNDLEETNRSQRFCPVCRYVLVDLIDPTQHGAIDADYAEIYQD